MKLGLIILAAFLTAPAPAQVTGPETGTRIPLPYQPAAPRSARLDTEEARRVMRVFAECTVQRSERRVERALQTHFRDNLASLASSECLRDSELTMPNRLLRGELYGALYRRDFPTAPAGFTEQPVDYTSMTSSDTLRALQTLGDCIVRAEPQGAHDLTRAGVGTTAERAAFGRIAPAVGTCVQDGQTLTFSKAVLSAIIMEALYHLSTQRALPAPGRN